jgi:hypothetical protein
MNAVDTQINILNYTYLSSCPQAEVNQWMQFMRLLEGTISYSEYMQQNVNYEPKRRLPVFQALTRDR